MAINLLCNDGGIIKNRSVQCTIYRFLRKFPYLATDFVKRKYWNQKLLLMAFEALKFDNGVKLGLREPVGAELIPCHLISRSNVQSSCHWARCRGGHCSHLTWHASNEHDMQCPMWFETHGCTSPFSMSTVNYPRLINQNGHSEISQYTSDKFLARRRQTHCALFEILRPHSDRNSQIAFLTLNASMTTTPYLYKYT